MSVPPSISAEPLVPYGGNQTESKDKDEVNVVLYGLRPRAIGTLALLPQQLREAYEEALVANDTNIDELFEKRRNLHKRIGTEEDSDVVDDLIDELEQLDQELIKSDGRLGDIFAEILNYYDEDMAVVLDAIENDAIEDIVPMMPIVLPLAGAVLMFLLAFIAVSMA